METRTIKELKYKTWKAFPFADVTRLQQSYSCYPKQLIGIEVEAENYSGHKESLTRDIWRADSDGSLRNNGVEFISYPIPVSYIKSALSALFSSIPSKNPLDFSKRTSIHIHMDVSNMPYEQLLNFVMLYVVFEDALFRYAGEFRKSSIFCVPIKDTSLLRPDMVDSPKPIMEGSSWMKYSACNLLPVSYQGTVEFRHLRGTGDIDVITTWVELLCRIKKAAERDKFSVIQNKLFELTTSSQYYLFALDVFKEDINIIFPNGKFPIKELDQSVKFLKAHLTNSFLNQLEKRLESPLLSLYKEEAAPKLKFKIEDYLFTDTINIETTFVTTQGGF